MRGQLPQNLNRCILQTTATISLLNEELANGSRTATPNRHLMNFHPSDLGKQKHFFSQQRGPLMANTSVSVNDEKNGKFHQTSIRAGELMDFRPVIQETKPFSPPNKCNILLE